MALSSVWRKRAEQRSPRLLCNASESGLEIAIHAEVCDTFKEFETLEGLYLMDAPEEDREQDEFLELYSEHDIEDKERP